MRDFLLDVLAFRKENIYILSDEEGFDDPTYDNIKRYLEGFVVESREEAEYIFLFCGHAKQKPEDKSEAESAASRPEEDGKDEYIIPMDAVDERGRIDDSKIIRDNMIRQYLVDPVRSNAHMLAIWDTCHSNTLMDLDHSRCNRVSSTRSRVHRLGRRVLESSSRTFGEKFTDVVACPAYFAKEVVKSSLNKEYHPNRRTCTGYCRRRNALDTEDSKGRVICISACKDGQGDLEGPCKSFTKIFIATLKAHKNPSLKLLLRSLENAVHKNCRRYRKEKHLSFQQSPQISSRTPLNMNEPLFLYKTNSLKQLLILSQHLVVSLGLPVFQAG
ncbi:hypothetical protein AGABI1DRAFT_116611 [Agaricus bisporus var. burnettii JB137-S8]|uniref:Uncharacterized protein n=1 Tax=Agaricus bisporus var. burnettii (strain JB137-S8 / ATCC MYA-4627 / FGSC 10392) TaxID=597362 RepID=K5VKY0_AGABU|nr:uncharacterized protein AGABI1DRAFT_116611 [Agaricus bisporus var. burnettii JB137-S8]EKM75039.1 hypothetical protein AGABI1DRAFT_116611 [Agaricus bisporus var. burnettii JB137-S8]